MEGLLLKKNYTAPEFNTVPFPLEVIMDDDLFVSLEGDTAVHEDDLED